MLLVITVALVTLTALNAILTAWATVLDARHASALMRALGANSRQVSSGLAAAHDGVQVGDPALTVIQADHRDDLLAPAGGHRSPPLEVEGLQGNTGRGAEAVHDPPGDGRGTTNRRHRGQADHHAEPSRLRVEQADQPVHVTPPHPPR
jgi:hypothetical protein